MKTILIFLFCISVYSQEVTTIVTEEVTVNVTDTFESENYSIDYISVETEKEVETYEVQTIYYYNDYKEVYINKKPSYYLNYNTLDKLDKYKEQYKTKIHPRYKPKKVKK